MYWQEVPYRAVSVLRGLAQSRGLFSASRVPRTVINPAWGRAWCRVPTAPRHVAAVELAAQRVLDGDLEVFGQRVEMAQGVPDWNADPVTGARIAPSFGLFIDFRHIGAGVDIKHLWEVNRHLWWVCLAQNYALTGNRRSLERIGVLLSSWLEACPYALGANWSSPVEHGIRLINWSIVWSLIGGADSPLFEGEWGQQLRARWLDSIYQHIRFASDNYSLHSSADNHLIGEAAGVFVAAHTWDRWIETRELRAAAKAILEQEAMRQFSADGVNLEQAICYHKFSLQFLLASGLCARANQDDFAPAYWLRVESAVTFLASIMDCAGHVPAIGDADDGEVWCLGHGADFDGYRSLVEIGAALFQRADLQAKVQSIASGVDEQIQWLDCGVSPTANVAALQSLPTSFAQGGYVIVGEALHSERELRAIFDCGPLGYNKIAGHGHADALAVLVSWEGDPLLVDAGTYCYNAAPDYRHFFRGTHAHNTLVVDGQDQSEYGASFLWLRDVKGTLLEARSDAESRIVHASHDGYMRLGDPVMHHRRVTLESHDGSLVVEDWLECKHPHDIELLWHAAPGARLCRSGEGWELQTEAHALRLAIDGAPLEHEVIEGRESPPQGWVSSRFYQRSPAPVLAVRARLAPLQVLRTVIQREGRSRAQARGRLQ